MQFYNSLEWDFLFYVLYQVPWIIHDNSGKPPATDTSPHTQTPENKFDICSLCRHVLFIATDSKII